MRASRSLGFCVGVAWTVVSFAVIKAADPVAVELSRMQQVQWPVVIGDQASPETRRLAAELSQYLEKMSGAPFAIETGDGRRGIVLGKITDFSSLPFTIEFEAGAFHRETYLLRTHAQGLYLLGATDLALSHAVWDLLYRLGYRQFFPGSTWEVIPPVQDLKLSIDVRETPDFHARRIWYNWGTWGYNEEPYRQWCQRNRMAQGFGLNSGHAYDSILAANAAEFQAHPEYFSWVDGQRRTQGGDIKFCISNPGLQKLVVDHAIRTLQANPNLDSISMDPSDGGNWCACEPCRAMGSVSDRALLLANKVAQAINGLGLGEKYVGMYAYNEHSPPPSIKADPHVVISATTAFLRGGFTFDQIIEGWQARGATMGVYDYLSVVGWDWNLPRNAKGGHLADIQTSLPYFYEQGARFYDAESGDCWGPCGLGYYLASRVLWETDAAGQADAIIEDFLDKAFGAAKESMRTFYHLINQDQNRRPPADVIGRMYRALDAAQKATTDPNVHTRLKDLILYTRYAELYYAFAAGQKPVEAVARHAYQMRKTMMIHSYGLWSRLINQQAALTDGHPWKTEAPFTADQIATFLAEGIANNEPVDPGFKSIAFSRDLVPAAKALRLPHVAPGHFPDRPQERQHYYIWMDEKTRVLNVKVQVNKLWANRMPKLTLYSPLEVKLEPVAVDESYKPDGQINDLKLATPYSGLHRVETLDGGDHGAAMARGHAGHGGIRHRHARRHGTFSRCLVDVFLRAERNAMGRRLGFAHCELGAAYFRSSAGQHGASGLRF